MLETGFFDTVGADLDPACLLGTAGCHRPAKFVMIQGQVVAENGHLLTVDEKSKAEKADKLVSKLLNGEK